MNKTTVVSMIFFAAIRGTSGATISVTSSCKVDIFPNGGASYSYTDSGPGNCRVRPPETNYFPADMSVSFGNSGPALGFWETWVNATANYGKDMLSFGSMRSSVTSTFSMSMDVSAVGLVRPGYIQMFTDGGSSYGSNGGGGDTVFSAGGYSLSGRPRGTGCPTSCEMPLLAVSLGTPFNVRLSGNAGGTGSSGYDWFQLTGRGGFRLFELDGITPVSSFAVSTAAAIPAATVSMPEPSTLLYALFGFALLARNRRNHEG